MLPLPRGSRGRAHTGSPFRLRFIAHGRFSWVLLVYFAASAGCLLHLAVLSLMLFYWVFAAPTGGGSGVSAGPAGRRTSVRSSFALFAADSLRGALLDSSGYHQDTSGFELCFWGFAVPAWGRAASDG